MLHSIPSQTFDLSTISMSCYDCVTQYYQYITVSLNTLCSKKSDAKIQINITTAYLIRIKYPLSSFNYHLSDVIIANFNKIHRTVSEQQLF